MSAGQVASPDLRLKSGVRAESVPHRGDSLPSAGIAQGEPAVGLCSLACLNAAQTVTSLQPGAAHSPAPSALCSCRLPCQHACKWGQPCQQHLKPACTARRGGCRRAGRCQVHGGARGGRLCLWRSARAGLPRLHRVCAGALTARAHHGLLAHHARCGLCCAHVAGTGEASPEKGGRQLMPQLCSRRAVQLDQLVVKACASHWLTSATKLVLHTPTVLIPAGVHSGDGDRHQRAHLHRVVPRVHLLPGREPASLARGRQSLHPGALPACACAAAAPRCLYCGGSLTPTLAALQLTFVRISAALQPRR